MHLFHIDPHTAPCNCLCLASQVAMYAVDSLRQLAMKFLERDELANYTFQNDFLRPFVVVMRQSQVRMGPMQEWRMGCAREAIFDEALPEQMESSGSSNVPRPALCSPMQPHASSLHVSTCTRMCPYAPHAQAVEIRELIIRCLSQMVLARVNNVKSGWKSMFMVFTTAAGWYFMSILRYNT